MGERREKRDNRYFLTTDGRIIKGYDITNAWFIATGNKVSPFDRKTLDYIVTKCAGIVKELDDDEAADQMDDLNRRGKHGRLRID